MRETFPRGTHRLYDRVAGRLLGDLFRDISRQRPEARAVLDIGCGPGHLAHAIARTHPAADVLGLDLDPKQTRIARRHGSRARFQVGASHALPLPDGSRDWIVATEAFHHFSQPQRSLREVHRVLAPDGEAWIVEPVGDMTRDELRHWTRLHRLPGALGAVRMIARRHGYTQQRLEAELLPVAKRAALQATALRERGWWRVVLRKQG